MVKKSLFTIFLKYCLPACIFMPFLIFDFNSAVFEGKLSFDNSFILSSNSLICSNCNIHTTLDTDFVISYESLCKCILINETHINSITDIPISSLHLKELFNFLITFMNSNINQMHKIKGIKEILYPGQSKYYRYKNNLKKNIVIPSKVLKEIEILKKK